MTNIDILKHTCNRCGHTWIRRRPNPPKVCPRCKRWDWMEKKR